MDTREILRWWEVFKSWQGNPLTEVRIMDGKKIYSGYFDSGEEIVEKLAPYDNCAIYFTLNSLNAQCRGRSQYGTIKQCRTTTSGTEIVGRDWILIDFDPKRLSGTSATDEEKKFAKLIAGNVFYQLRAWGFPDPVTCDSGNGYHILYRCSLDNTEANTELIKKFLRVVDSLFGDAAVDIDTQVFDPNRICKLYGTVARKGSNTKERPHRLSRIIRVPKKIEPVPQALLEKVVKMLPEEEKPTYDNNYGRDKFDIDFFIQKYGIEVHREVVTKDGTRKIILKECPFDSSHKAPDSAIFVMPSGAIAFKCFHNSCSSHGWKELREMYEPSSLRIRRDSYSTRPNPFARKGADRVQEDEKEWLDFPDIKDIDKDNLVYIPSKINELDARMIGFCKGETTIWSGSNASGKSSLINTLSLNAVEIGFKVAMWSGELPAHRLKHWIMLAAAGAAHVSQPDNVKPSNFYFVEEAAKPLINEWLRGRLWIYNNNFGNKWEHLLESIREKIMSDGIDAVVIDNLMALDIDAGRKALDNQKLFIQSVENLAKEMNVHIHLICHPRKVATFLRKTDISGTADLTNAVDNVIIVHRNNQDFRRSVDDFYPRGTAERFSNFGNIIEFCKGRYNGLQDELFGLYFEIESKRFFGVSPYDRWSYYWDRTAEDSRANVEKARREAEERAKAEAYMSGRKVEYHNESCEVDDLPPD